jgi:hypothetical protein
MRRYILTGAVIIVLTIALLSGLTGCFFSSSNNKSSTDTTTSTTVVKPSPEVVSVVATTSGTQAAYYATLDIKVKNTGAEGTILVKATLTQNGKSSSNQMPVFLKQNESHELKLTFPLVWQGGDFNSNVETVVP